MASGEKLTMWRESKGCVMCMKFRLSVLQLMHVQRKAWNQLCFGTIESGEREVGGVEAFAAARWPALCWLSIRPQSTQQHQKGRGSKLLRMGTQFFQWAPHFAQKRAMSLSSWFRAYFVATTCCSVVYAAGRLLVSGGWGGGEINQNARVPIWK